MCTVCTLSQMCVSVSVCFPCVRNFSSDRHSKTKESGSLMGEGWTIKYDSCVEGVCVCVCVCVKYDSCVEGVHVRTLMVLLL